MAEEVDKVNPDLVIRDKEGKPCALRPGERDASNEFLNEHKAFLEEQTKVQDLPANAIRQEERIETLAAELQKVSAQIELIKSVPETASNHR